MNIRRSTSISAGLLLASALAVAACSSSSAPGSTGGPGGDPTTRATSKVPGDLPAVGGGSCSVDLTGGETASWQASQDVSSVLITYWLGASERAVLNLAEGEESFLFNCQGEAGQVSVYSTSKTTSAQFPLAAGSYVIPAGSLLGGGEAGQVSMILTFGDDSIWRIAEAGTFNITTLNRSKFAGNYQAKVSKMGEDFQTVVATATLSGTFDFGCSGTACG